MRESETPTRPRVPSQRFYHNKSHQNCVIIVLRDFLFELDSERRTKAYTATFLKILETGSPVGQFPQPQAAAPGFVQPQGAFQPSQPLPVQPAQQPAPFTFSNNNNNPLVPALVPIGNLPIASQATSTQAPAIVPSPPGPSPPIVPSQPLVLTPQPAAQTIQQPLLLPAQFALSANSPSQRKSSSRTGKSLAHQSAKSDLTPAASSSSVIDCGSGNDLGFCASSEKYPR